MFDLRQAFDWLPDAVLLGTGAETVKAVSTDTRTVKAGDLFVALRGDNFDAHDFVGAAIGGGAAAVVVGALDRRAPSRRRCSCPTAARRWAGSQPAGASASGCR